MKTKPYIYFIIYKKQFYKKMIIFDIHEIKS